MIRSLMTLGILGALAAACTVDNRVGKNDEPDSGLPVCRGAGPSPVCPSTWELAQTQIDCIPGVQYSISFGHSGVVLGRMVSAGNQTSYCLYDPSTYAVVGGWRSSWVADFCNETAHTIYYGVAGVDSPFVADLDLEGPTCIGRGECHAPLAEAACAPTWQQAQSEPLCLPPSIPLEFGHAAGYLARSYDGGLHGQTCYYDPVTFALTGEWQWTDIPIYCDDKSFDILYGDATPGLVFRPDLGPGTNCPDAGTTP